MTDRVIVSAKTAAEISGVTPSTVRAWIHRGQVSRQPGGGIDVRELIDWLDRRDPAALARRAGLRGEVRRALAAGGNRAARLLADASETHLEMVSATPPETPETLDPGGWLRHRRI